MRQQFRSFSFLIIGAMGFMAISCGDDKDSPQISTDNELAGKWQKYATVEADGSLSEGDTDEFWIFYSDGSFVNEDGGEITTKGTYTVSDNTLTIMSREVDGDRDEENFTGTFNIYDKFMDYTFTEIGYNNYTTLRFLKQ